MTYEKKLRENNCNCNFTFKKKKFTWTIYITESEYYRVLRYSADTEYRMVTRYSPTFYSPSGFNSKICTGH